MNQNDIRRRVMNEALKFLGEEETFKPRISSSEASSESEALEAKLNKILKNEDFGKLKPKSQIEDPSTTLKTKATSSSYYTTNDGSSSDSTSSTSSSSSSTGKASSIHDSVSRNQKLSKSLKLGEVSPSDIFESKKVIPSLIIDEKSYGESFMSSIQSKYSSKNSKVSIMESIRTEQNESEQDESTLKTISSSQLGKDKSSPSLKKHASASQRPKNLANLSKESAFRQSDVTEIESEKSSSSSHKKSKSSNKNASSSNKSSRIESIDNKSDSDENHTSVVMSRVSEKEMMKSKFAMGDGNVVPFVPNGDQQDNLRSIKTKIKTSEQYQIHDVIDQNDDKTEESEQEPSLISPNVTQHYSHDQFLSESQSHDKTITSRKSMIQKPIVNLENRSKSRNNSSSQSMSSKIEKRKELDWKLRYFEDNIYKMRNRFGYKGRLDCPRMSRDLIEHCVEANEAIYLHAQQFADQIVQDYHAKLRNHEEAKSKTPRISNKKSQTRSNRGNVKESRSNPQVSHQFHHHYYY